MEMRLNSLTQSTAGTFVPPAIGGLCRFCAEKDRRIIPGDAVTKARIIAITQRSPAIALNDERLKYDIIPAAASLLRRICLSL